MLGNVDGKNDMLCSRRHNERSIRVIEVVVGMQELVIAVTLISDCHAFGLVAYVLGLMMSESQQKR